MKTGVIILGHGSRAKEANLVFTKLVEMIEQKVEYDLVTRASMELAEPNLEASVADLVAKEVEKIVVVPLFLFPGIHMQEDIPCLMEEVSQQYPAVEFLLGDNIGADEKVAEIMVDRIAEVG